MQTRLILATASRFTVTQQKNYLVVEFRRRSRCFFRASGDAVAKPKGTSFPSRLHCSVILPAQNDDMVC